MKTFFIPVGTYGKTEEQSNKMRSELGVIKTRHIVSPDF